MPPLATASPNLTVMIAAARKAARRLVRDFGEVENLQVSRKGPGDFVSGADRKAEETIRDELMRARPAYGFLAEESGESEGGDGINRWIVDPLDGTTNFLHGLPHWAISIALERKGEIVAGVVYDPVKDELYAAEKGGGAFVNDRRLRVSGRRDMSEMLFATGVPFMGSPELPRTLKELARLMPRCAGVRRFGTASLDLAYVASGTVRRLLGAAHQRLGRRRRRAAGARGRRDRARHRPRRGRPGRHGERSGGQRRGRGRASGAVAGALRRRWRHGPRAVPLKSQDKFW
jgi:myo-inositol-1(or 4)-monophosphatase